MESKNVIIKYNGEYIDAVAHYDDNGYHGRGGYGTKLATCWKVNFLGRERRIYCDVYSNVGRCYIMVKGEKVSVM